MEWAEIEVSVTAAAAAAMPRFGAGDSAEGYFCQPEDGELHVLRLTHAGDGLELGADPLNGRVKWRISTTP